jgi:Protein of unknown function (DUF3309)
MSIAARSVIGRGPFAPNRTAAARRFVWSALRVSRFLNRPWNLISAPLVSTRGDQLNARVPMLGTILLIILILLLIGGLPTWGYSSGWGYYPSGGIGLLLVIVIILLVMGRI